MATIEHILEVKPHPNADKLELAMVLGYQCVVPKDTYKAGDTIIYVQPDNVLPTEAEWSTTYRKYAPNRIKAIKLRNEWSEGLIIDLGVLDKIPGADVYKMAEVGTELSEVMGIVRYESPENNEGNAISLPYNLPKTDENRSEKLKFKLDDNCVVDVTLKIDGQSWSAYYNLKDDRFGILGRKTEINLNESNNYTQHNVKYDIETKLRKYCKENGVSLCIRGESYGKGIQNNPMNPHCKLEKDLAIFSVYLINEHRYAHKGDKYYYPNVCKELGLPTVPMLEENVILTQELIMKYSKGINKVNDQPFEGVVIKGEDFSFKVINKQYDSSK